ncbi:hypothetical protein N0V93_004143 [Gnomoniopsis smithogilvyi]|uniref:Folliculin-interacting protein N-terminal domain-containing protein n=1 Tax=Gnomoniopsis smithogilvyi TaxID=1191159 RepID=A0A9W8YQJ7_9PEZI|nr:hypothetical protein N0V93_004143 [Gnomoniopsis smithogilvyi]
MLGKLFNLNANAGTTAQAQASSSKEVSSLESVQEDIHTRCLLFPDAQALYQQHGNDQVFALSSASAQSTSSTSPFDLNGDLELETRDVRVIVMQDTSSSSPASLLYDSQPLPPPSSPVERPSTMAGFSQVGAPQESRRFTTSQRKASTGQSSRPVVIQSGSPQPRQSAFDRRSSVQGHGRAQSKVETESQKAAREYKQEIDTFAGCIFGNNEFLAYKGTSTKVHVVPSDLRNDGLGFGDGRGSIGRSAMRTSKLSQSFTSEGPTFGQSVASPLGRPVDRKRVLITRLFPVNLPADDALTSPPGGRFTEDSAEFPFPDANDNAAKMKVKKAQLKQKRTPMYAVALIISLPQSSSHTAPASAARSAFRGSSSYGEQQDSFPSSYSSARRSGWAVGGSGLGGFDSFDSSFTLDSEERIDAITRHWDVIMRTLTSLQSIVATEIFSLLKQADIASPDPLPNPAANRISRASSNASQKPPKTNMKFVSLVPNCLADDTQIKSEVDNARVRIVSGLRATRVVTGQNRWGIWREEARWVERWGGGRDQGFFFFNLLTGFLSVHTDWLQALSPSKYRKQYSIIQKTKGEDDLSLPARTIVVGQDRTAARRLIFLLAAFLPGNQQLPTGRAQRPSTSASFGNVSQSPPSFVIPLTKEESLRRKINRRGGSRHNSHSRNASMYATTSSTKNSVPAHLAHLSMDARHERRASDATSIKTTNLPLLAGDLESRKVSAATMIPETSIPHFTVQKAEAQIGRPASNSSLATDDLKRSLQRGDSIGSSDTQPSSRWGSVISGLWNGRRRDSEVTNPTQRDSFPSPSRNNASVLSPRKSISARRDSLGRMVEEARSPGGKPQGRKENMNKAKEDPHTPRISEDGRRESSEPSRAPIPMERKPDPNSAFESPVKTTINEDGIIDVDVPFPEFITSFETAVSSPSSSGYLFTPGLSGLDLFEQASPGDVPMNVAGWLQRYHPDFILQAIPPQPDLLEQIKASLRAEPTPLTTLGFESTEERWIDVSSALIADSTTFSIRRIRYRRLVRPNAAATPLVSTSVSSSVLLTPMISPYEVHLQDEFIEDEIVTLDDTLIEAVEKVTALGSESSQNSSRSPSKRRESVAASETLAITATESEDAKSAETPMPAYQEVPRGECKIVVLSALEHIAKEVVHTRENDDGQSQALQGVRHRRDKESVLREAVRTWVDDVEAGLDMVQ